MKYKVIGLMSGSSLDGLDIVYAHYLEVGGKWTYDIKACGCWEYSLELKQRLRQAVDLNAREYLMLGVDFAKMVGDEVNRFIQEHDLEFKVDFVVFHGHTTFHVPHLGISHQLGCCATLSGKIHLPVIGELRMMDVVYGGQGAPIIPMGEKLLFNDVDLFLNIGGIANLSFHQKNDCVGFDVAPANTILNYFAQKKGLLFDDNGHLARRGKLIKSLLEQLDHVVYFEEPFPKSLSNDFGKFIINDFLDIENYDIEDVLHTYCVFLGNQIKKEMLKVGCGEGGVKKMMISGGGALNGFLIDEIRKALKLIGIEVQVPDITTILYKEALVMGVLGILRWREEKNVLKSVTGASKDTCNGGIWYDNGL